MLSVWVVYYGALFFILWGYAAAAFFRAGGHMPQEASVLAMLAMGITGFFFFMIVDRRGFRGAIRQLKPGKLGLFGLGLGMGVVLGAFGRLLPLAWGAARPASGADWGPALGGLPVVLVFLFLVASVMELGARAYPLSDMLELMGTRRALLVQAAFWPLLLLPYSLSQGPSVIPGFLLVGYGYSLLAGWLFVRSRGVWAPGALFAGMVATDGVLSLSVRGDPLWCGASGIPLGLLTVGLGLLLIVREK